VWLTGLPALTPALILALILAVTPALILALILAMKWRWERGPDRW
jgi:hypothetical protein